MSARATASKVVGARTLAAARRRREASTRERQTCFAIDNSTRVQDLDSANAVGLFREVDHDYHYYADALEHDYEHEHACEHDYV